MKQLLGVVVVFGCWLSTVAAEEVTPKKLVSGLQGAKAVAKVEAFIPAKERPFSDLSVQVKNRQKLICAWWQPVPNKLTA